MEENTDGDMDGNTDGTDGDMDGNTDGNIAENTDGDMNGNTDGTDGNMMKRIQMEIWMATQMVYG